MLQEQSADPVEVEHISVEPEQEEGLKDSCVYRAG
jgi:hypothetical protein